VVNDNEKYQKRFRLYVSECLSHFFHFVLVFHLSIYSTPSFLLSILIVLIKIAQFLFLPFCVRDYLLCEKRWAKWNKKGSGNDWM
jgi:hypothetical protein